MACIACTWKGVRTEGSGPPNKGVCPAVFHCHGMRCCRNFVPVRVREPVAPLAASHLALHEVAESVDIERGLAVLGCAERGARCACSSCGPLVTAAMVVVTLLLSPCCSSSAVITGDRWHRGHGAGGPPGIR